MELASADNAQNEHGLKHFVGHLEIPKHVSIFLARLLVI